MSSLFSIVQLDDGAFIAAGSTITGDLKNSILVMKIFQTGKFG
jgi:bifunctional N-acetylglucosamine-1-phosphate-uridyltransferase/glucosamine-1-phosphate-acetyltransferase GlmU-like protein